MSFLDLTGPSAAKGRLSQILTSSRHFVLSVSATLDSIDFKVLFPKKEIHFFQEKNKRPTESKAMAVVSKL